MAASILDPLPDNVVRLRIKGAFKLNREPHGQIEGWDFFHMNEAKVDWAEAANAGRAQLFPNVPLPEPDPTYEELLRARRECAAQAERLKKEKKREGRA